MQIRLERGHEVIAVVQVWLEGQLAHVQQSDLCARLLGAAGILAGQGVAEAVGLGITVDDEQSGGHGRGS
ncbi:hypothetical protein D3C84_1240550 [compost metagenome]